MGQAIGKLAVVNGLHRAGIGFELAQLAAQDG